MMVAGPRWGTLLGTLLHRAGSSLLHVGRPKILEGRARHDERKQLLANLLDDRALPICSERVLGFELSVNEYLSVAIGNPEPLISKTADASASLVHDMPSHLLE